MLTSHVSPPSDIAEGDGLTREAEVDRAAELLARYDPGSRRWDVQKQGNFWRACALLTDTSSSPGPVVAVVDDAFDTSLPALAEQTLVWPNGSGERTVHGTSVALSILEVAPHAQLLLYPVARGGTLDEQLAARAVDDAAARGAAIVNLSMSRRRPLTEWFDIDALRAALLPSAHGVTFAIGRAMADTSFRQWLRVPPSALGDAVLRGGVGTQVVAAVGNANGKLATPAVLPGVLGVGFMTEARSHAEGFETATPEAPDFAQSGFTDFSLRQPAHVLGSSFATPLLSGFCARACTRDELTSFVEAARLAGQADELWRLTRVGQTRWDPTREGVIDEIFLRAVRASPHQHQLSTTAVPPCAACALFMTQLYVDYGLFKLNWADLAGAEVLLRTVRGFAPTDPGAAAGLATAHAAMAATHDAADDASLIRKGELLTSARDHMGVAAGLAPENRILPLYVADYESPPTQLRLRFDDAAELDELKQLASSVGLSAQEGSEDSGELSSDIEPVTMLLIGGGVLAAAKFLTDWLDKRQGGMVVDQRPGADNEVRRDKGVSAGYVVVFPQDGGKAQISIHDQPKDAVERLLADIVSGAFSTAAELAKAAGAALGEGAKVETAEVDA